MAEDIVYGRAVVGLALALVALQIVVLVMADAAPAARRHTAAEAARDRGRCPSRCSGRRRPLVHAARALIFEGRERRGLDADEKATALSRGMSGRMSTIPFTVTVTVVLALVVSGSIGSTLHAERASERTGAPEVTPGDAGRRRLLPMALGALQWSTRLLGQIVRVGGRHRARGQDGDASWARFRRRPAELSAVFAASRWQRSRSSAVIAVIADRQGVDRTATPPGAGPPTVTALPLALSAVALLLAPARLRGAPDGRGDALPLAAPPRSGLGFRGAADARSVGPDAAEPRR